MPSSIYQEFENAKAVARARLWPSWARLYPALQPRRWYRVWDIGQDAHGVFLDIGRPRYVSRDHVPIEPMPGRSRELQGERLRTSLAYPVSSNSLLGRSPRYRSVSGPLPDP